MRCTGRQLLGRLALVLALLPMATTVYAQGAANRVVATAAMASGQHEPRVNFPMGEEEYVAQARAALQNNGTINENIGAIRTITLDHAASLAEEGAGVLVFDLTGSKGKGRVTADFITVDANTEAVGEGELVMADGSRYALAGAGVDDEHGHDHDAEDAIGDSNIFVMQAREAAQRYPLIQQYIGDITRFDLDMDASAAAPGSDEFVFNLEGSKGKGRLQADFVTVDADTERLGEGTLTMANGQRHSFDGEPPSEDETHGDDEGLGGGAFDAFSAQAMAAMQGNSVIRKHLGEVQSVDLDLMGSMGLPGEEFVFDVTGSKRDGRVSAEFITVDADTERLGDGVLILGDQRIPLQ